MVEAGGAGGAQEVGQHLHALGIQSFDRLHDVPVHVRLRGVVRVGRPVRRGHGSAELAEALGLDALPWRRQRGGPSASSVRGTAAVDRHYHDDKDRHPATDPDPDDDLDGSPPWRRAHGESRRGR